MCIIGPMAVHSWCVSRMDQLLVSGRTVLSSVSNGAAWIVCFEGENFAATNMTPDDVILGTTAGMGQAAARPAVRLRQSRGLV